MDWLRHSLEWLEANAKKHGIGKFDDQPPETDNEKAGNAPRPSSSAPSKAGDRQQKPDPRGKGGPGSAPKPQQGMQLSAAQAGEQPEQDWLKLISTTLNVPAELLAVFARSSRSPGIQILDPVKLPGFMAHMVARSGANDPVPRPLSPAGKAPPAAPGSAQKAASPAPRSTSASKGRALQDGAQKKTESLAGNSAQGTSAKSHGPGAVVPARVSSAAGPASSAKDLASSPPGESSKGVSPSNPLTRLSQPCTLQVLEKVEDSKRYPSGQAERQALESEEDSKRHLQVQVERQALFTIPGAGIEASSSTSSGSVRNDSGSSTSSSQGNSRGGSSNRGSSIPSSRKTMQANGIISSSSNAGARMASAVKNAGIGVLKELLKVQAKRAPQRMNWRTPAPRSARPASAQERAAAMEGLSEASAASPASPAPRAPRPVLSRKRTADGSQPAVTGRVKVQRGDTLVNIAARHRMRVRDLQQLNGLASDIIVEGAMLTVAPGWVKRPKAPEIRPGIRRTSRFLFSRKPPGASSPPAPSTPLGRRNTPQQQALRPAKQPQPLGVGGPAARLVQSALFQGRWRRGPKGFSKSSDGWLRFASPLSDGFVSSPFGMRWGQFHGGVDLAADVGYPIQAAEKGIVTFAGWAGGYGKLVTIVHDGGFSTRYAHCSAITACVGQRVARGQRVGHVGATGRATGPHLHFEVRKNGEALDPFKWCDL